MSDNYKVDILIIGAGGGGLCAAVKAAEAGAKVVVLEKRGVVGGNTIISGGRINIANTKQQKVMGIEDSTNRHFQDTIRSGDYVANPELVWALVSKGHEVLAFLQRLGMKFQDDQVSAGFGGIWPRGLIPMEPRGKGYLRVLKEAADRLGVDIITNCKMTELIREDFLKGKVLGVKALNKKGEEIFYEAKKAVIIASGGFAGDAEFRMKYDNRWNQSFPTSNYPGCSAEAMVATADAGADLVGMDYIQCLPKPYDLKKQVRTLELTSVIEDMIYINEQGERIINSDARRDLLRNAIFEQSEHTAFQLCDERGRTRFGIYNNRNVDLEKVNQAVQEGKLYRGSTVKELADKAGIDTNGLVKTIDLYNHYVSEGFDSEFLTNPIYLQYKIDSPPFYAWKVSVMTHFSIGGLRINTKAEVFDRWGKVIPNLFAVGEVTGGIHGANRVGGNALLEIFAYGLVAAENALDK